MRKTLTVAIMVLSTTFIFASSADLIEKINKKVESLKQELNRELDKNGMNYQTAGSFTVEADNIKIEAYAVPEAGEKLMNRLSIVEIRDRGNFEKVLTRTNNLPEPVSPVNKRSLIEIMVLLIAAIISGITVAKLYLGKNKKEREKEVKSEDEKQNSKKAA